MFSQIARYADNDIDNNGQSDANGRKPWSQYAAAIDYDLEFGYYDEHGSLQWEYGDLYDTFDDGWTTASQADNHVARWIAPRGIRATHVRVKGGWKPANQRVEGDFNAQIDAIVAGKSVIDLRFFGIPFFAYYNGYSSYQLTYTVQYEIESPDGPVDPFTISLYGTYDGITPAELVQTVEVTDPSLRSATSPGVPHSYTFYPSASGLAGYSGLIAVINDGRDVVEFDISNNQATSFLTDTGFGVSLGGSQGSLTDPAGLATDGSYFYTVNGGSGDTLLIQINAANLSSQTPLELIGTGVNGSRDWQDVAVRSGGEYLFIADIGAGTSSPRVLKMVTPGGIECTNDVVLNTDSTLEPCEYDVISLSFPSTITIDGDPYTLQSTDKDGRTLLVEPNSDTFYIITTTGTNNKSLLFSGTTGTMTFVGELPFDHVVGGDSEPSLLGGEAILLKVGKTSANDGTVDRVYRFPFRNAANSLGEMLMEYAYWEVPYDPSHRAADVAIAPGGEGYFAISEVPNGSGQFTIWHSQPSVPLTDVIFRTDAQGEDWVLDYTLSAAASSLTVSVYRSADGIAVSPSDKIGEYPVGSGGLTAGPHSIEISPNFSDSSSDYKLVAMVGNTRYPFSGGAFRSNSNTVHVSGGDGSDQITIEPSGSNIVVTVNGATYTYTATTVPAIQVRGQDGSDAITVSVSGKNALLFGGAHGDVIDGSLGQGTLVGGNGDDELIAGSAVYVVDGGNGDDGVPSDDGDDVFAFTGIASQTAVVIDRYGNDTLDFGRMGDPVSVNLTTGVVSSDGSQIQLGTWLIENVTGSDFGDTITGNQLGNYLSGGLGADTYHFVDHAGGTLGSDTIDEFAEIDGDTLDFSALTSTVLGSGGITIDLSTYDEQNVAGTNGSGLKLTLTNPPGVDNVVGTTLADTITGNDADNVIEGGAGNDTLDGRGGSDTYVYAGSAVGTDMIFEADAADDDTVDLSGLATTPSGNGITANLLTGIVSLSPFGSGGAVISSPSGIENVIGTTGDDAILGNARANRIEGGLGDDTLAGDRGDDVYVFARETGEHLGLDVIHEFGSVDHDTLDFSEAENARLEVDLSDSTNQDTLFEYNGTWVVKGQLRLESIGYGSGTTIEGVVGTAGNDLIKGNLRPNRLEGGIGDDTLWGYNGQDTLGVGGDDTYVFARIGNENLGVDEIREASLSGYDTLDFSGMNLAVNIDLGYTGNSQEVVEDVLSIILTTGDSMAGGDSIEHVIGSPHDDTIRGNSLANHLRGGLGDDTIEGWGDDDILDGGEGSDTYEFRYESMLGALGDDLLREGEAADSDTLDFSEFPFGIGVDLETGVTVLGVLTLALNRADGVENVIGTAYGDTLIGNGRANLLVGNAGGDSLLGFDGDDTLEGGEGADALTGGVGNDTYVFARTTSQNLGTDSIAEAADVDSDTLDFSGFALSSGGISVRLYSTSSWTIYSGDLSLSLSSDAGVENVVGSPGHDDIEGNSRANVLEGGEGDDTLTGLAGEDTYVFARIDDEDLGSDTIAEQTAYDALDTIDFSNIGVPISINATEGAETDVFDFTVVSGTIEKVIGSAFGDSIFGDGIWLVGGPGNDTLTGSTGSDTLEGGEGDDELVGGAGNDVYRFRRQFYEDLGVDRVFEEVGEGTDLLDFADFGDALFIDLALNSQQRVADRALELLLLQDDDTTRSDVENVTGSDFDDELVGNELGNHLIGGDGNDTLEGGVGNDSLEGGVGDDTYSFAQASTEDLGDDTVSEAAHRDFDLLDFSGFKSGVNVNLTASGMNNVDPTNGDLSLNFVGGEYSIEGLIGTDYADTLTGNKRPNWLEGGKGDDTLSGDLGDDRYVFRVFGSDSLGTDVIQNEVQYGGRDVIDFADFLPSDGLGINGTSGFNLGTLSGSTAQTLHSQLSVRLHTTAVYLESVVGTPFADNLIGNNYANVLIGGDGDDTLEGGVANDTLEGGAGDDSLVGGNENDTYLFDRTETDDLGHDTLVETASAYAETLDFSLFGEGIAINLGIGGTAQTVVEDKLILTLSSGTAFDNVIGSPFADTIRGNGNNNLLAGGNGDDTYVFARSTDSEQLGSDTITDMDGNDTLDFEEFGEGIYALLYNSVLLSTNQFQVNRSGSSELTLQVPANQLENVTGSVGADDIIGIGGGLILGGDGNDTLQALGDDATLRGGAGDDSFVADNYRQTLEGGEGDDSYIGDAGDTTYVFSRDDDTIDLGDDTISNEDYDDGNDALDFSGFAGQINLDLTDVDGQLVATGLSLTLGDVRLFETIIGSPGDDTIVGDDGDNYILGGDGIDSISGGVGNDTLVGEGEADVLVGGDGDDVLEGGVGNDALEGGAGNDEYVFAQTDGENLGSDSLTETTNGGTNDALMFNDFGSGVEVYLSESGNGPIVGHSKLTLTLVNADTIERLEGSNFDDVLVADAPALSVLYGHAGNDILIAGDGDNASLYGGSGDDYLVNGDAGSTTMYGEEGDDELVGGNHPADLYGGSGDDQLSSGTSGIVDDGAGHDIVDEVPDSDPSVGATVEPTAISLVLDPSTEVERGAALELALSGVSDADGIVLYALYYWDADDDGELNLEFDRLVGSEVVNGVEVTSEVSISTAGLPVGEARFFARVVDSHGLFSEVYEATIEVVDAPPRISQVLVSSTEWAPEFYTALGNATGYAVPSGTFELRTLPWMNLNRIHIRFTEDVNVQAEDFQLFGVNLSEYTVAAFSYDAATFTATWTLDSFIAVDKLRIYLSDDITDLNGNHLDGEWVSYPTSGWSTFPSGNGTEGGNFSFRFNVLPGDVNGLFSPYTVSSTDVTAVSSKRGWAVGAASYSYRADLDGNGIIDEVDYILVMQYNPSSLPSGEPYEP